MPLTGVAAALLVALAVLPGPGQAQAPGTVYGTVSDTAGTPIGDVRVTTAGAAAASDGAGRYRLAGIAPGRAVLRFTRLGYLVMQDTVAVPAGDSVRLDVTLRSNGFALETVIVTAAKRSQLLDRSATSVALVSDSDLARRALSTVDEAVDKAPGVLFLNGQVNIRGSSGFVEGLGSRVLLLVDGVPANEADRGGIDWDMLPLDEVQRVEVVKGAGSSLYGSAAFGGVVNLLTRDVPVGLHGRVRATAGTYADPPDPAWRFRDYVGGLAGLDVTGSYGSEALRARLTLGGRHSDGYREQDRSDQWEGAGKAEWRPAPGTRVTASGSWTSHQYEVSPPWCERGQCDDRGLAFQPFMIGAGNRGAYTRSDKGYVATTVERTSSAAFAWHSRASWVRTHFTDSKPDDWGVANRYGTELRGTLRPGGDSDRVLTVGVEAARADVTSDIFGEHAQNELSAYGEGERRIGSVRLSAGARLDEIGPAGGAFAGQVSPRVGVVWPTRLGTWRGSIGHGFRTPSLAERFVSTVAFGIRVVPDSLLVPETAWAFELGDAVSLGSATRLDAAAFWTDARQLIEPAFFESGGVPYIQFRNVLRARLRGFDLSLVARPLTPRLETSVAYTFLDARDLGTDSVLAFRPKHLLTLAADYRLGSFTVGGDFRYVSRIERIELGLSWADDPRVAARVLDLRAGWRRDAWSARLLVTNALNYIYSLTPGTLEPVRTASVALTWTY